jgi:hypothetical protein
LNFESLANRAFFKLLQAAFNRTMLELKFFNGIQETAKLMPFNRTMLELKSK